MVRGNLRQQYNEVHVASSSAEETVLMLYDGAIRFLKEAATKIAEGNIPAKVQLLEKAEKIIDYLESCLDREQGGEIAENLQNLYHYMLVRLTEANLYNDAGKMEEIGALLRTVREGWASICDSPITEGAPKDAQRKEAGVAVKKIIVSV